ncbi:tetratricopeptide repeat protein [Xanthomonas nasturtii]|uniref:tetratricopeptide repeat protein n=1 Tax=Xanthomonas TaxID=338 RepID=UPI000E1FA46F|nr:MULTISPECIES: tetratricopeptide repeat protein [Xanthomonas]MEA9581556.1 tetratricopeptide repeat protein [Xanthomonas nasturtii]
MQDAILQALRRNAADDAVALAREWATTAPDNAAAHRWLGLSLQQQGQPALALTSIETALTLTPEDADLHLLHAGLLLATRNLSAADAALSRSTALDPNQFNAYVMQAHLAVGRGDLDDAERLSRTAARLAPDHPQLLAVDGVVEMRRGQSDRALSLLTRAAEQLPDDPRVMFALGFAYLQKEHFAFAERAFERVVELNPPGTALRAFIAQLAQRQGRLDDALTAMQGVLAQPDGDIPAMRRLAGEMELQAGRPDQAAAHLRLALAHWPADRRTLHALLTAWERLGAVDDARDTLDAALATSSNAHDLWLARLAVEPVGGPQAQAVIERWLLGMPEHLPALEALMRVHDMQGHAEDAEMVARQIVAVEPGRISGEQRIVEALLERDPPAAIACVESLIESLPAAQQTVLRPWLGNVQDRAGQPDAALATWMQFHREQAQHRLPLPPQAAKQPMQWPALGSIPDTVTARPLFVWGTPGSHVERLVAVMDAATPLVRGDRYGATPPSDALQSYRSVEQLASGELAPMALVEGWKAQLLRRGIDDGNVIDWLLWWDNTLLTALRPHLPEGRLAIALRDPRDMLLDWLSAGASAPLAVQSPQQATDWLLAALEQLAVLHERDLYPHRIIRLDGIESDPQGISTALEQAFGLNFPLVEPRGPARLASGRWRSYRGVLGAQFDLLTLIAVRFGYPQD